MIHRAANPKFTERMMVLWKYSWDGVIRFVSQKCRRKRYIISDGG